MNTRTTIAFTFLYPSPEGQYEAMLALPRFRKKGGFPMKINGLSWFSRGVSSYLSPDRPKANPVSSYPKTAAVMSIRRFLERNFIESQCRRRRIAGERPVRGAVLR